MSRSIDSDGDLIADRREFYAYDAWDIDGWDVVLDFVDPDGDNGGGSSAPPALAKRYLHGAAVDQILAEEDLSKSISAVDRVLWHLADNQGTTRELVKQDGSLATGGHFKYDAFGRLISGDASLSRYLYTGQEFDAATGLYYYNARWYDPAVGRFISEDPIGFSAGDTNLSRYVGNSPTNYTDPSGLAEEGNGFSDDWGAGIPPIPSPLDGSFIPSSLPMGPVTIADLAADQHRGLETFVGAGELTGLLKAKQNLFGDYCECEGDNLLEEGRRAAIADAFVQAELPPSGYWAWLGDAFKGYGDAAVGAARGAWFVVRHPIQTAQGIGTAILHPIQTGQAIYAEVYEKSGTLRGQGELVGDVLIGIATGGTFKAASKSAFVAKILRKVPEPVEIPCAPRVHGNSLEYVGKTHVYVIRGPNGPHKIGQSMRGVRKGDGASIRGEAQARALQRQTDEFYRSEIRETFPDKRPAREYETRYIETFRRLFGDGTLPGNKTNR